jgi:hypothetical protein
MGNIKWVLQHGINRFLSLLPSTDRILQVSEGLKSYFNSEEQCPLLTKFFFRKFMWKTVLTVSFWTAQFI